MSESQLPFRRLARRLTVGQFFALACGALTLLAIAGGVGGAIALSNLAAARSLMVDKVDPASRVALDLANALVDEESGVRGYVISGQSQFLEPYYQGRSRERADYAKLARLTLAKPLTAAHREVAVASARAAAWRTGYALPTIARRQRGPTGQTAVRSETGKALFDSLRSSLNRLELELKAARLSARASLAESARTVEWFFGVFGALLIVSAIALTIALRLGVSAPLARLSRQARTVARGKFGASIEVEGPRDMAELASDVDSMRRRILSELEALREANELLDLQKRELARSNAELEQFAYVASHDLQEPIRKVASFTQLLQRRYAGQLDERAEEYISFAVDGAKRMQTLINDLLAFSRVGRISDEHVEVNLGEALSGALSGLSALIEETGATINAGELPSVRGEAALLSLVFQNLVGNALKFRGERRPVVSIRARRQEDDWLVSVADNGIGIDPQYAERIFVIFQRLHPKEQYEGTGIGLAMCRKIVEFHGGRIWLDRDVGEGTTFNFTLPAAAQERTR